MKARDLSILKSLEKYKCLTRDQIAALHFQNNARPHISANQVLKRLRRDGYVIANTDRSFQQYVYFPNPSTIKIDSQKIDHFLLMNQTIIEMMKYAPIKDFHFEFTFSDAEFIADIYVEDWLDKNWFIECQNSLYTTKQLYSKLDKYKRFHDQGYWFNERVLIVGKVNLKFNPDDYPFKIKQVKCVDDLGETIKQYKKMKSKQIIIGGGSLKIKV